VGRWLAPGLEPGVTASAVTLLVLAALGALFVWTVREAVRGAGGPGALRAGEERTGAVRSGEVCLFRAVELTAVSYVAMILVSRALADSGIPLDDRIVAPLFLLAAIAIGTALAAWWRAAWRIPGRIALFLTVGFAFSWAAGQAEVIGGFVHEFQTDGGDLAGASWRQSPLVAWAAASDARTRLYSNWPAAVWFHTGRAALALPDALDAATVAAFRAKFERENGAVLVFREPSPDVASPDSLASLAGLVAVARWQQGTVWRVRPRVDSAGVLPRVDDRIRP
jgi:hypothetical protein